MFKITRSCARLPGREKELVLGIVRQFEGVLLAEGADGGASSGAGR